VIPCEAIHLHPTRQLISPQHLLEQLKRAPAPNLAAGALNIRLFRITNGQPGDTIMDSLGLAAVGLPDVQCHFRGLNPDDVAKQLYNIAAYIFDVRYCGRRSALKCATWGEWKCQRERSLVGPERRAGCRCWPEYAAGRGGGLRSFLFGGVSSESSAFKNIIARHVVTHTGTSHIRRAKRSSGNRVVQVSQSNRDLSCSPVIARRL
jgi:hypothetical protein